MDFIFLRVMEIWTQWVPCKVDVTYFAHAPLRSYFHDPQKNEIYFLIKGGHLSLITGNFSWIFVLTFHFQWTAMYPI